MKQQKKIGKTQSLSSEYMCSIMALKNYYEIWLWYHTIKNIDITEVHFRPFQKLLTIFCKMALS